MKLPQNSEIAPEKLTGYLLTESKRKITKFVTLYPDKRQ